MIELDDDNDAEELLDPVEISPAGAPPRPPPPQAPKVIPPPPAAKPAVTPAVPERPTQTARAPTLVASPPPAHTNSTAAPATPPVRASVPPPAPPRATASATVPTNSSASAPAARPSPPLAPSRVPSIIIDDSALDEAPPAPAATAAAPPPPTAAAPPVAAEPLVISTGLAPVPQVSSHPLVPVTPLAESATSSPAPSVTNTSAAPTPPPAATPAPAPTPTPPGGLDQRHASATIDASLLPVVAPTESAPLALPALAFEWAQPSANEALSREIETLSKEHPSRAALLLAARALDTLRSDVALTDASMQRAHALAPESRALAFVQRFVAEQLERTQEVPALLRAELPLVGAARERAAILLEQVLRDERAGALDGVERALKEAVSLDPKDPTAWDLLAHYWLKRRNPREAAAAFEQLANALGDQALRSVALAHAAYLREASLDDAQGAVSLLRRALETHPGNLSAWAAIETLHLRAGTWVDHARALVAQGAQVDDAATAREHFDRAGDAFWMGASDVAAAIRCYEHVFGLSREDPVALEKLRALLESAGRWEALVGTFERLVLVLRDPIARACALYAMAGVLDARLDRPEESALALRRALDIVPTFAPAADALSALLRRTQRHAEWCALELSEAERVSSVLERASRIEAIAVVYECKLGREDDALALYERALALDPACAGAAGAIERILRGRGDWEGVLSVLSKAIDGARDPKRKRSLEYERALVLIEHSPDRAQGAAALQKVLEGGAVDESLLLPTLARARAQQGEWAQYIDALEKQADTIKDPEDALRHLHRVASTIDARLNDPVRALSAWNKVLLRSPNYRPALDAARALHAAAGRWEEVVNVDRKLAALTKDSTEAAHRLYSVGRVLEERLGRADKALEAYEQSLAKAPSFDPARFELERLLRALGRLPRLIELYEARATSEHDAELKSSLLVRAARVAEFGLKDINRALALYMQAAATNAEPSFSLWGIARVHEQRGVWAKAESALVSLLERAPTAVARMRLSLRLARLYELRLPNATRAAACFEDAIVAHSAAAMHVYDRLRLARADGAKDVVAHWQKRLAQASLDRRLSRALLVQRARLLEIEGAGADECLAAYGAALALEPDDPVALESQARSLRAQSGDPRWAEALRARAVVSGDRSLEALLRYAAGRASERSGRDAEAQRDYERALVAAPELWSALEAARALASKAGDWESSAQYALRSSEVATEPRNRAEAELDAAELFESQLDAPEQAIVHARAVLARRPELSRACALSVRLSEASEDWAGVMEALGAHAAAVTDPTQRANLFAQRAKVAIERLSDARSALDDLQKAFALDAKSPSVLDRLAREYERAARWREASDAWGALAVAGVDSAVRRRAKLAQARIWAERVFDWEQARSLLEPLVSEDPADREASALLAKVHALGGSPQRAGDLYAAVAQSSEGAERVKYLLAVADVSGRLLRDDSRAREVLSSAMDMAIADPSLIGTLEAYFARDNAHRAFVALGEESVRRAAPTPSANASSSLSLKGTLAMRLAIARVLRDALKNNAASDEHLRAAIEAFPRAPEPRLAKAQARVQTDELGAIAEYREILEIDPTCGPAFRGLVVALQRIGSTVSAGVVASAAILCGEQGREIDAALALAVTPPPREGALPPDDALALLVGQSQARYVRRLLAQLDPHWFELFPQGLESLRGFQKAPAGIPAVRMLEAISASLVTGVAQLYRGRGREALAVFAQPPALVLGVDYFAEGAVSHLIFECARMAAHIGGQSVSQRVLPVSDLLTTLEVVTDPNIDEPGYKDARKRAGSVLPRRVRKEIERIVEESGGATVRAELPRWVDEESRRGLRAGVVFARDLRTVAQIIVPEAVAAPSMAARREQLARSTLMVDALRFCASDACSRALERVFGKT
ncbi:MAG: hypothetical protein JNK05_36505 [Myxococcales bacterium]|nr:hypothetical protein [Myxococcales bacterium]